MGSSFSPPEHGLRDGKWLVWAVALAFLALLSLRIPDIFAGVMPGADDLMRIQQIRDLLGGQGWFNVDQSRMLTPEGGNMHWSRLPDLFIAGVILVTEPFLGRDVAEKLAVSLWPLVLLAAVLSLLAIILRRLGANTAGQVFALVFFATSAGVFNFWPGRIDHHGLVVTLSLLGFAAIASPGLSARSGVVLAFAVTGMMTVALEGLPYVAGLIAIMALFWIVRGHREGVRFAAFGLALMGFSTLFFVFDAPGFSPRRMVCDAYGTPHWVGFLVGGGLFTLLGIFGGALDTWVKRLVIGTLAGGLTLAVIVAVNPACLGDPYAAVPESVRLAWLNMVREAKPLSVLLSDEPARVVWVFGFLAAAAVATVIMMITAAPSERLLRVGYVLLLALSIVATVWQVRGQSFSHVFAAIAAGWGAGYLFSRWREQGGPQPLLIFAAGAFALSPLTWETLSTRFAKPLAYEDASARHNLSCTKPEAYADLVDQPPMRIHAPVILNVWIVSRTPHSIFAGPYHRNIAGIERLTNVYIGSADEARDQLIETGATHLLYCRGLNETNRYELIWPDGFAAELNRDELPDWLVPADDLTETEGTVRLYRILPPGA
ncbi:MAG: hypothetical protein AAGL11_01035 [Pseudomonadota bacterium]